jgi:hypothetical protein
MTGRFGQRPPPRAEPAAPIRTPTRVLTGIERALLEARLAAEPAAPVEGLTLPPPELESEPAEVRAPEESPLPTPLPRARRLRPRPTTRWSRPAWMAAAAARRPARDLLLTLVPLAVAAVVWATAQVSGNLEGDANSTRFLILAVALAGPVATLGALMARAAWPRLVGLVLLSGLGALLLIGRSLIV